MRTLGILIGSALIGGLVLAQRPWPPPGMNCPQRTLVIFEHGPNHEKAQQLAQQHLSYLLPLMKSGKIISAGPMEGGQTAAMLFATKDWSEIEGILKDEPFLKANAVKVAHHDLWNACEAAK